MTDVHLNLIAGAWCAARGGETFASVAADGGDELARFPRSQAADVDDAVRGAHGAAGGWARMDPDERARTLRVCGGLLRDVAADAARTVRLETRADEDAAGRLIADSLERWESHITSFRSRDTRRGVWALVTSWHQPFSTPVVYLARALTSGATVVLKPSEDASLSAALVAEAIGPQVPAGVVNVVYGTGEEAGMPLVDHPDVTHIRFSGSRQVLEAIRARCRGGDKSVSGAAHSDAAEGVDIS